MKVRLHPRALEGSDTFRRWELAFVVEYGEATNLSVGVGTIGKEAEGIIAGLALGQVAWERGHASVKGKKHPND